MGDVDDGWEACNVCEDPEDDDTCELVNTRVIVGDDAPVTACKPDDTSCENIKHKDHCLHHSRDCQWWPVSPT